VLRRVRRGEGFQTLGILAYLASFIVLPGVHLSNHRADHRHEGDEIAAHLHGGASGHRHTHARPAAFVVKDVLSQPPPAEAPIPDSPPGHGHGSAAHLSAALVSVATYVFLPVQAPSEPTPAIPVPALRTLCFGGGAHARGPPTMS
jgi:hypothetical protein